MFSIYFGTICFICCGSSNYRLQKCSLRESNCASLVSALKSKSPSHLRELDLRINPVQWDLNLFWLSNKQKRLETLR